MAQNMNKKSLQDILNAPVFLLNGDSYCGKNLEAVNLEAGKRRMMTAPRTNE